MFISNRVFDLFDVNKGALETLKEQLTEARTELAATKSELATTKANFAWITGRMNTLEYENKVLMEKAYGVKIPAPQFVVAPKQDPNFIKDFGFDDVGDTVAKQLGFDLHDVRN